MPGPVSANGATRTPRRSHTAAIARPIAPGSPLIITDGDASPEAIRGDGVMRTASENCARASIFVRSASGVVGGEDDAEDE